MATTILQHPTHCFDTIEPVYEYAAGVEPLWKRWRGGVLEAPSTAQAVLYPTHLQTAAP
jgi:hypothetical protein